MTEIVATPHAHHAHGGGAPDHHDDAIGHAYKKKWVQDLLAQIDDYLKKESAWLGLERTQTKRILDYACGNGIVSRALYNNFPDTTFHGLDVSPHQVQRYRNEAAKLLGDSQHQMEAIVGNLLEPNSKMDSPEWHDFDAAVISMALHHVDDPVDLLSRLKARVRKGGIVVVLDWLAHTTDEPVESKGMIQALDGEGPKIWPGFRLDKISRDMESAGLTNIDVVVNPDISPVPKEMSGYNRMYLAKGTVV